MKFSRNSQVLLLFILVAIVIRFFSFFSSVLDHDESTYLVMGSSLAHGKSLYVDVTDSKPVGIFAIYTFLQYVFGYSIFLKRLFVAVVVGFTAYSLHLVSKKIFENTTIAIASGFIYIYCTSTWNYFGLSPNTELFFNFFTINALWLFFHKNRISYLIAGLLLGIGFIIKYLVLFDFVALSSFFLLYELIQKKWKISVAEFLPYFLSGIGFSIPFVFVNLYFYFGDHFEAFRFITYELPGRYMEHGTLWDYFRMLLDFSGRFLPVSFLFFYVIITKKSELKGWKRYLVVYWLGAVLLGIYLPGRAFSHYTIQLMLPVSLVAGVAFHPHFVFDKFSRIFYRGKVAIVLLVLLITVSQFVGISAKLSKPDEPRVVAEYLKDKLKDDETVFVSNFHQILYYLLHKEPPTKYVHSTILGKPVLASVFNVNAEEEISQILLKKPKYILVKRRFDLVQQMINDKYTLDNSFFDGKVLVYRLND